MATDAAKKVLSLPEGSDLVTRSAYSAQLQRIDRGLAHQIAEQTNTSTTAYTTDAPFQAYYTGMRFMFMPLYDNTGAATLNVNSLGAKKLLDYAGNQLTAAGAIEARSTYWLEYDATLDGGAGAFKAYPQSVNSTNYVDRTTDQSIAGEKTFSESVLGPKWMLTPEGGIAIKLTNKTGAASVANAAVQVSVDHANAVALAQTTVEGTTAECIGAFYESGVADGSEAWIVIAGLGQVLIAPENVVSTGQMLEPSQTAGQMRPFSNLSGEKSIGPVALQALASSATVQTINVIWSKSIG